MSTYDALASLPVTVESCELTGLRADVVTGSERLTTVVHLHGEGETGVGEDVDYSADEQRALQAADLDDERWDLSHSWALGDLCDHIDALDLFLGAEPEHGEPSRRYRRWAFHAAALDLALRQAGRPLHAVLERPVHPLTFVVSPLLGEPASVDAVAAWLRIDPTLRFKLDATGSWTPPLCAALAATGAVDTVDFKAHYELTPVDDPGDGELYRRVLAAFPDVWIEDPDVVSPDPADALADVHDRITWDAPIHSVADIEALPFAPRMVNVKPSRIGGLERLCATYDYCAAHGIAAYGGGLFELGPGRGQAQYLAAIFHPDGPNDLAPVGYNAATPPDGLPRSPLTPAPSPTGFTWETPP